MLLTCQLTLYINYHYKITKELVCSRMCEQVQQDMCQHIGTSVSMVSTVPTYSVCVCVRVCV